MACLLGHKWNGCKCEKCGKERDTQHDWNGCKCKLCGKKKDEGHNYVSNSDKCEKVCSACGDIRISHDLDGNTCKKCGKTIWFTDEERKMIGPIEGLIFLKGKIDTGLGNASFIETLSKFDADMATVEDARIVINTVNIFKETICKDDPQSAFLFGNNRKQICNNLLEKYKEFIIEKME